MVVRSPYRRKLIFFLVLTFFWFTADIILTYLTPLLAETREPNLALVGLIISMGSVAGIAADLFSSWKFSDRHYTFFYTAAFIIAMFVPLLLPFEGVLPVIILIMIGGIQYELFVFGQEDFLGHHIPKANHTTVSGLILMVTTMAALLTPLIVNPSLENLSFRFPFLLYIILLAAGALYFFVMRPAHKPEKTQRQNRIGFINELKIWTMLTKRTSIVFLVMLALMFLDAIFWMLGPLLSFEYASRNPELSGLFIPLYMLPGLFAGVYAPKIASRVGELRAAIGTLFLAGVFLIGFLFTEDLALLLILNLVSSIFSSATLPLIEGVMAHLIERLGDDGGHFIGLRGFATDIGYIIGPIFGGIIAETFSIREGFAFLGIVVAIAGAVMLALNPRPIRLPHKKLHELEEA
ncbi:MAG: Major Facilitator Superfamily protein [candidate division WS6 bacterium OLB20]|uniref:Major Facilitator Superfamily protein n=1 Tax=candidate division WS6 bacterium OLB20 TaxID=1617426 RepID=A0A136LZ97_9BACT|nr:MAG: Major Facilitator Superfamily protein [candidate division WS6 bacterium OLB20]